MESEPSKEKIVIIRKAVKPVELPKNVVIQYIKVNDKFNPKDVNLICNDNGKAVVVDGLTKGRKAVAVYADSNRPNKVKVKFNRKKKKKGVLIAVKDNDGVIRIGWSLCNFKHDQYDQNFALRSALLRTRTMESVYNKTKLPKKSPEDIDYPFYENIPESVKKYLPRFIAHCVKYYKSNVFTYWIGEYFSQYIPTSIKKEDYFPKEVDIKFITTCDEVSRQELEKMADQALERAKRCSYSFMY